MKLRNIITKEICDAEMREDGIYIKANWSDEEKWFCYDLETLARSWEYYVDPKEPLIKDEKIRKAVRAWADANSRDLFRVINEHFNCCKIIGYTDGGNASCNKIEFGTTIASADKNYYYNIEELCGEEEK